jgi:hypothetical protein
MRVDTPAGRFYSLNDPTGNPVLYPSVTTVLGVVSKDLENWAAKQCAEYIRRNIPLDGTLSRSSLKETVSAGMRAHEEILRTTGEFGTSAHWLAEVYMTSGVMPDLADQDPAMRGWASSFARAWDSLDLTALTTEQMVWSHRLRVAGTMDCLASDKGRRRKLYVVDLKTCNSLRHGGASYALQAVIYKQCLVECWSDLMPGLPLPLNDFANADLLIIRVGRTRADIEIIHVPASEHPRLLRAAAACRTLFDFKMDGLGLVESACRSFQDLARERGTASHRVGGR